MSTDIFQNHYNHSGTSDPYKSLDPLQFYFTLSVPLTAVTLLVWAYFHFLEVRRARRDNIRSYAKMA